jgi:hypothetical protein
VEIVTRTKKAKRDNIEDEVISIELNFWKLIPDDLEYLAMIMDTIEKIEKLSLEKGNETHSVLIVK